MNRNDFDASFMNFDMPAVRHAHIMKALAIGPAGRLVGVNASLYNEMYFLACYALFRRHPTRKAAILMSFHCMARNNPQVGVAPTTENPWEILVDPVNRNSEAHIKVRTMCGTVSHDYNLKHADPNGGFFDPNDTMRIAPEDKARTLVSMFMPMVSQIWLYGGPMREYLAAIGNTSHDRLVGEAAQNREIALQDEIKAKWLDDRIRRANGTMTTAQRFGVTFDPVQVGLQAPVQRWVRGRTPIVIGNRR